MGYNSYGYLSTISAEGSTRYTITGMNAREQLTEATYGSNLTATLGFDMYGYSSYQWATYTSLEKVNTLNQGTLTDGVYSATFVYNSDNQRAKMDITQSDSNILTRWNAGSSYMKETAAGVTKKY